MAESSPELPSALRQQHSYSITSSVQASNDPTVNSIQGENVEHGGIAHFSNFRRLRERASRNA